MDRTLSLWDGTMYGAGSGGGIRGSLGYPSEVDPQLTNNPTQATAGENGKFQLIYLGT